MSTKISPKTKKEVVNIPLELLKELYRSYDFFNSYFCKGSLPRPMIIVASSNKARVHGWFRNEAWMVQKEVVCEITLCAETFQRGLDDVLDTLLHEMAHLKNFYDNDRKVVDCTPQQRHNKVFKTTAEFFGLDVSSSKRFGSGHTSLGKGAREAIKQLKPDSKLFELYQNLKSKEDKDKKKPEVKLAPVMIGKDTKELIMNGAEILGITQKEFTETAVKITLSLEERIKKAAEAVYEISQKPSKVAKPTIDQLFEVIKSAMTADLEVKITQ